MAREARPVFIGGLDRSGKTPLRQILDASSTVAFSRRSYLWTAIYGRYGDLDDDANLARCLRDLERHPGVWDAGIDLAHAEATFRHGPRDDASLVALIGEEMARAAGRERWGVQEGGLEDRAGLVFEAFPQARVLHMIRDPRDRHLAIAAARDRPGLLGVSLVRWRTNARRARHNLRQYGGRYLVIRFEDLAADPVAVARRVGHFIDEPDLEALQRAAAEWSAEMKRRPGTRADLEHDQAMRPGELLLAQRLVGPELRAYGYPMHAPSLSAAEWIRLAVADLPLNAASAIFSAARNSLGTAKAGKLIGDEVRA
ncbi:MAG: sulfotransferase [Candidatus Limnocylindria bacterium]